jgi:tetratricopeptide (TPR) repeat protein
MLSFPVRFRKLTLATVLTLSGPPTALADGASSMESKADDASDTSQAAAALFVQARAWMKAARYDEACRAFENSQRLDPASGTLLNLGVCRQAQGRTRSAYLAYQSGLALSQVEQNAEGERIARECIAKIEPALTRIVLSIRYPRPTLGVRLDGVAMDPGSWGKAVLIDPGSHEVESFGPDQDTWSTTFDIAGPVVRTLDVESPNVKISSHQAVAPALSARPSARTPSPPAASAPPPRSSWPLFAAVGAAGNDHCPDGHCDRSAVTASERAARYARAADVAAGLAALGGVAVVSIVIYQSQQRLDTAGRRSLRLESNGANIAFEGAF